MLKEQEGRNAPNQTKPPNQRLFYCPKDMNILRADTESIAAAFKEHVLNDIAQSRGCAEKEAEMILVTSVASFEGKASISRDQAKELKSAVVEEMVKRMKDTIRTHQEAPQSI